MHLTKIFIVFVAVIGRKCLSEIILETSQPEGFAEMGNAAVGMLTACYTNQEKTIVLAGEFPGNFIQRLLSHQMISVVLLDDVKRSERNINMAADIDVSRKHKTHVFVTISSGYLQSSNNIINYMFSHYDNPMSSLIILCWSPVKNRSCNVRIETIDILYNSYMKNMLNANLMSHDCERGVMIYTLNAFVNRAPEPWKFVESQTAGDTQRDFYLYEREFRRYEGMCDNLDFDKTQDLGGADIRTMQIKFSDWFGDTQDGQIPKPSDIKRIRIEEEKSFTFIDDFITYVNATRKYVWQELLVGENLAVDDISIYTQPVFLRGIGKDISYIYPHKIECKYLVSQFRGNKSQLRKIVSVIDSYSWIGMFIVYSITLIFFKCFLGQSLMAGMLNLCRLSCNVGLENLPFNVASRVYLACLLFFIVTMQGIFVGNLASLLTHDFPVQQVDSITDLAELGYKVWAEKSDFIYFDDPIFDGRRILRLSAEDCIAQVIRDPLIACLTWSARETEYALKNDLHISTSCVANEYASTIVPLRWPLEERLNMFLGMKIATSTMMPLRSMVEEKRLIECESVEDALKPKVMTLRNLSFSFAILGVGLGVASICLIVEIIVYRLY